MIILRQVFRVKQGKSDAFWEQWAKVDAKYAALGLPPSRRSQAGIGGGSNHIAVVEREWEDLAALHAGYEKRGTDPTIGALVPDLLELIENEEKQIFWLL